MTVPDQTPSADDPARSPYPVWRPTAQYPEGYKVVWKGSVYQAKWYNQGADPSTVVGSQWETPWALIGPVGPDDVAPTITTVPPGSAAHLGPDHALREGHDRQLRRPALPGPVDDEGRRAVDPVPRRTGRAVEAVVPGARRARHLGVTVSAAAP